MNLPFRLCVPQKLPDTLSRLCFATDKFAILQHLQPTKPPTYKTSTQSRAKLDSDLIQVSFYFLSIFDHSTILFSEMLRFRHNKIGSQALGLSTKPNEPRQTGLSVFLKRKRVSTICPIRYTRPTQSFCTFRTSTAGYRPQNHSWDRCKSQIQHHYHEPRTTAQKILPHPTDQRAYRRYCQNPRDKRQCDDLWSWGYSAASLTLIAFFNAIIISVIQGFERETVRVELRKILREERLIGTNTNGDGENNEFRREGDR